jgi:hypothetical protein
MTIQQLNGAFRTSLSADLGRVVMTNGIASSDAETIALILEAVRTYDQFDEGIDQYGEHDMGRFALSGEDYYWKIDYYDRNLELHCNRESFCDWRSWARGAKGCAVSTSSNRER